MFLKAKIHSEELHIVRFLLFICPLSGWLTRINVLDYNELAQQTDSVFTIKNILMKTHLLQLYTSHHGKENPNIQTENLFKLEFINVYK